MLTKYFRLFKNSILGWLFVVFSLYSLLFLSYLWNFLHNYQSISVENAIWQVFFGLPIFFFFFCLLRKISSLLSTAAAAVLSSSSSFYVCCSFVMVFFSSLFFFYFSHSHIGPTHTHTHRVKSCIFFLFSCSFFLHPKTETSSLSCTFVCVRVYLVGKESDFFNGVLTNFPWNLPSFLCKLHWNSCHFFVFWQMY